MVSHRGLDESTLLMSTTPKAKHILDVFDSTFLCMLSLRAALFSKNYMLVQRQSYRVKVIAESMRIPQ